jgi:hypothetical protein
MSGIHQVHGCEQLAPAPAPAPHRQLDWVLISTRTASKTWVRCGCRCCQHCLVTRRTNLKERKRRENLASSYTARFGPRRAANFRQGVSRRRRTMSSDNDITIQCTMKYKTSDKGHESSARLSWILVDGGTVMPQGSHAGTVG